MRNMSIDTYTLNISKFCFDVRQTVIALLTIILATVTQTALAQEHSGTTAVFAHDIGELPDTAQPYGTACGGQQDSDF